MPAPTDIGPPDSRGGENGRRAFSYAVIRVVPSVERGEFINVGVVVFSRQLNYLAARVELDRERLAALDPDFDPETVAGHLDAIGLIAAGDPAGGAVAALPPSERFGWLAATSSTSIQSSPVHTGLCSDPAAMLDELFTGLVR